MLDKGSLVGRFGALVFLASILALPGATAPDARFIELLPAARGASASGFGFTAQGVPVGWVQNARNQYRATIWPKRSGKPKLLKLLKSTIESEAFSVNSHGQIVGDCYGEDSQFAVIWRRANSKPVNLGSLPGATNSSAYDINDSGQAVGESGQLGNPLPVIWEDGATLPTPLSLLTGYSRGVATAINNNGDVVGFLIDDNHVFRAILWPNPSRAPVDLGVLPGGEGSKPTDINESGDIVGWGWTTFDKNYPLLWRSGEATPTQLMLPVGASTTIAWSINDSGTICGGFTGASGDRAVVWPQSDQAPVDLLTEVPTGSEFVPNLAYRVDNAGRITGYGNVNGRERGFRITYP